MLNATEKGCINLMSDLIALQLVDRVADDRYVLAQHVKSTSLQDLATHIQGQFSRHVVCRELSGFERGTPIKPEVLDNIVRKMKPPGAKLSDGVVHQYGMNLKRWLLFSGHLEERAGLLYRPLTRGSQMGILTSRRTKRKRFLGSGTSEALGLLLRAVVGQKTGVPLSDLVSQGLRNAIYDALSLGLMDKTDDHRIYLLTNSTSSKAIEDQAKRAILREDAVKVVAGALQEDPEISNAALGERLKGALHTDWKPASSLRYANGIKGYYTWAMSQ
jgi:hypothetical protein